MNIFLIPGSAKQTHFQLDGVFAHFLFSDCANRNCVLYFTMMYGRWHRNYRCNRRERLHFNGLLKNPKSLRYNKHS